jgi:hypothetical protein
MMAEREELRDKGLSVPAAQTLDDEQLPADLIGFLFAHDPNAIAPTVVPSAERPATFVVDVKASPSDLTHTLWQYMITLEDTAPAGVEESPQNGPEGTQNGSENPLRD